MACFLRRTKGGAKIGLLDLQSIPHDADGDRLVDVGANVVGASH